MRKGTIYLGKRCRFADECPVYQGKVNGLDSPQFLIKNVFCNRGIKGWKNCKRFNLLEQDKKVTESTTPYKI